MSIVKLPLGINLSKSRCLFLIAYVVALIDVAQYDTG